MPEIETASKPASRPQRLTRSDRSAAVWPVSIAQMVARSAPILPVPTLTLPDENATLALGATFYLKLGGFHVGAGLRFGQDRPLLGLGLKVD